MHQILKSKISRSTLLLVTLLSMQVWNVFGFAPQGCEYENGEAICYFGLWTPPLLDKDFGPEPVQQLKLNNINGTIPAGAFSGLNGPLTNRKTDMYLNCYRGEIRLSRNIFTPNLHWLEDLRIYQCYLKGGMPSRLLENLKSLKKLSIWRGGIVGMVAHDTLAGLTNLQHVILQTPIKNGTFPTGLFDGLTNLTMLDLRDLKLGVIPPNWFKGLFSLEIIHLGNNNLQLLPEGLFSDLTSLRYVSLYNNPWHCSCGLRWLLDWSDKTGFGVCHSPSLLENIDLEDALGLLECTSTPGVSVTETAEIQKSSFTTFAGLTISNTSASIQKELIPSRYTPTEKYAIFATATTIHIIPTTTVTPKTANISSQPIQSTSDSIGSMTPTMLQSTKDALTVYTTLETTATPTPERSQTNILTVSETFPATASTATKPRTSLAALSFAYSKFAQISYSATPRRNVSYQKSKSKTISATSYRYAVAFSAVGAVTLLFVVANHVHGANRVNNGENSRHNTDPDSQAA